MTQNQKRILLGKIATAHGVRGMVKITMYGEDPATFEDYGPLYTAETGGNQIGIVLKGSAGKHLLAEIKGVTDRNEAEKLRGTELWIPRGALPEPIEGQYYYEDLTGMNVENTRGERVGKVVSVQNFGAGDLFEIAPVSGGETYFITFTRTNVPVINVEENRMVIAEVTYAPDDEEN